jgi:hypothetical protein
VPGDLRIYRMSSLSHCATTACDAPADAAFAFLADPARLGSWALGCWNARIVGERVARGASLFDESTSYVRVEPDRERLLVDFAVGDDAESLVRRISARVLRGDLLGYGTDRCLVTVVAWRPADMTDERWERLVASHAAEILLLKAKIEACA